MFCWVALAKVPLSLDSFQVDTDKSPKAIIGAVEELAQSTRTITLVKDTFETNFFANVNVMKAFLPTMRERKNGHIIMLTGTSEIFQDSTHTT